LGGAWVRVVRRWAYKYEWLWFYIRTFLKTSPPHRDGRGGYCILSYISIKW
jgi:hypothetical protein